MFGGGVGMESVAVFRGVRVVVVEGVIGGIDSLVMALLTVS